MTEKEKLAELYRLYEKQLYAIALAVLHNHAQAEDAVSEAYYRVVRHIGMLGKPDSPQTRQYMIRTIRSMAISQYRKNQRESAHLMYTEAPAEEIHWGDDSDCYFKILDYDTFRVCVLHGTARMRRSTR